MVKRPALPDRRNPMLEEERAPAHDILIGRRCLGQTELKVKPGQVGTVNATKPDNLGMLDYAHLRVPLPKDLSGSGIFTKGGNRKWPEAYFLMRRSSDGFISATGMFKAAFPYAQAEEETTEKDYIKSLDAASSEEVAGNVWIDPSKALELADEYAIRLWITALLDPEPITHGTNDPNRTIQSPPTYRIADAMNGTGKTPKGKKSSSTSKGSARSVRSESPVKQSSSSKATPRKIATPRKRGKGARSTISSADGEELAAQINGTQTKKSPNAETIKVQVENTADGVKGEERTKVHIDVPSNHPDLKVPDNAEGMLAQARAMVRDAEKLGAATPSGKGKRKAGALEDGAPSSPRQPKKAKHVEIELRKERIRRRALTGIVASLAVGALIPSIVSAFSSAV